MGTEGNNNVRRCGRIGDNDELSMVDVLNEQARLQADANAVLGGSDENNCTYPEGYLNRQALYACVTCTPEGNAGVCLACSYACHEGHELYELYTKRFFTCDCGNAKFGGEECKLFQGKKELNFRNHYNQNFKGIYCSCARPYPDPDDTIEDQMIQCIMCEDWHHGRHLKATVPEDDDFQEMICPACMSEYSFLWAYYVKRDVTKLDTGNTNAEVDITTVQQTHNGKKDNTAPATQNKTKVSDCSTSDSANSSAIKTDVHSTSRSSPSVVKRNAEPDDMIKEPLLKQARIDASEKTQDGECLLLSLEKRGVDSPDEATFWPDGWRVKLCQCKTCMTMYKDRDIEFLIDDCDTVQAYEVKGRDTASTVSDEENEASALASMNRVQQIEMVRGFMDLRTELNEFLQDFARDGKVVTETDIREFFQRMNQRRRQQMQMPQHTCR